MASSKRLFLKLTLTPGKESRRVSSELLTTAASEVLYKKLTELSVEISLLLVSCLLLEGV